MIDKVKSDLRITNSRLDSDIEDAISACLADLKNAGIIIADKDDANYIQLVKLYCRWFFDFKDKGADFLTAYNDMKKTLSVSLRYRDE